MKTRLILLRKTLNLTQSAFAERLNLTRAAVSQYELGNNNVPSRTIRDICREFKVSEEWLSNGTGTMFQKTDVVESLDDEIKSLIKAEDIFSKKFILKYLRLPKDQKKSFECFFTELIKEMS